jgi:hypothetical protein
MLFKESIFQIFYNKNEKILDQDDDPLDGVVVPGADGAEF